MAGRYTPNNEDLRAVRRFTPPGAQTVYPRDEPPMQTNGVPYGGHFQPIFKDQWSPEGMDDDLDERPYRLWNKCLAEFVGTLVFVYVGTMNGTAGGGSALVGAALAHGFTIFAMVATFGSVSGGHFNPAVTLGVTLARKMPPLHLPFYWVSQLSGGITGAVLTRVSVLQDAYTSGVGGATLVSPAYSWHHGLVTEIMLTAILVTVILMTACDTDSNVLAPLAIGLTLALDVCAGGAVSGASMNPARSLGPNIMASAFVEFSKRPPTAGFTSSSDIWTYHWVYWAGPFAGAAIAASLYRLFFASNRSRLF